MAEFYAGGIVYTIKVDDQSGVGVEKATRKIRDLGVEGDRADVKLKSLSRDTAVLGGSLASLGGMAMVAGTAIGGPLGSNLQSAGMGVAFVGTGLATVTPALRGLSVMIDRTLIPSLIRLNAFLGPTGWIILGLAAATAAIGTFIYMQNRARDSIRGTSLSAEDAKKNIDGLNDAMRERIRLEQELAGLPQERSELEAELKGAQISERRAQESLKGTMFDPKATPLDLEEAQYNLFTAQRRVSRINEAIADLGKVAPALSAAVTTESRYQAAGALQVPYEQTGQFQFMERTGSRYAGAPINQTNTINITVASVPEAKMAADMYTDSRLTRLASAQGYPNAG